MNGNTLTYNTANQLTSAQAPPSLGGGTETFTYDGFGQRVKKTPWTGSATVYVYDIFGQLAAEYANGTSWSRDYVRWAGGQVIATENASGVGLCTTCYLSYDHLGSVRLVTDQNGVVKARHDFLPYGEEVPASTAGRSSQFGSTTDAAQKFTGQIRDQEATMDYFNARYFVAALSRFTSPDPGNAGVDLTDPQTWNAYAYVRNSPLHMVDPSGMDPITVSCPDCTVTVDGGSTDGIDPWDFPFYNRFFGYDPNSPLFTDIVTARAPAVTESASTGPSKSETRNCSAHSASAGQYVAASAQVALLTGQFFSGLGSADQNFGPSSATSQVMAQSGPVQDVLKDYYMTGRTGNLYTFGASGYVAAGANSLAQFVGSFRYTISPTNGGINLRLTNTTSFRSLTYDKGPQWPRFPLVTPNGVYTSPMGNTHQVYNIFVPCGG